jgi:hypothetical protein
LRWTTRPAAARMLFASGRGTSAARACAIGRQRTNTKGRLRLTSLDNTPSGHLTFLVTALDPLAVLLTIAAAGSSRYESTVGHQGESPRALSNARCVKQVVRRVGFTIRHGRLIERHLVGHAMYSARVRPGCHDPEPRRLGEPFSVLSRSDIYRAILSAVGYRS